MTFGLELELPELLLPFPAPERQSDFLPSVTFAFAADGGIAAVVPAAAPEAPLVFFPPWLQGQAVPHMTQHLIPSGRFGLAFWLMCMGKLTRDVNSGTCAPLNLSVSP